MVVPPAIEIAAAAPADRAPAAAVDPAPAAAAAESASKPGAPQQKSSSSITKWVLVIALAIGALGAWYYWSQLQAMARSYRTDTTAR
jgi:uncharacterized protein HemX